MEDFVTRILNLPKPKKALLAQKLPPLSFSQRRFWFFEKFENQQALNNILLPVSVKGRLDIDLFERCLNEVVKRHEILRTCFPVIEDEPVQLVVPELKFVFEIVELPSADEPTREAVIRKIIKEQAMIIFNLERVPLLAGKIIVKDTDEKIILLTLHHSIFDGFSAAILINEISVLYNAAQQERTPELPFLKIQYGDYVRWQRDPKNAEIQRGHLDFWKSQLVGLAPLFQFPTDRPRPPVQEFKGGHENVNLSAETTGALKNLARSKRASLFMALLAGFKVVLARYTDVFDIPVGCPVSGRTAAGTENLIGLFLNTLVMRTRFRPDATFAELLETVRETVLRAQDHQSVPFEKIVEEIHPERSLSYAPVFQIMFTFQTFSGHSTGFSDMQFNVLDYETGRTQGFDLAVNLNESSGGLVGSIEYDAGIFERETIVRLIEHYRNLLENAIRAPEVPISRIKILKPSEEHRLLEEWNGQSDEDGEFSIIESFEQRAREFPETIAAACGEDSVKYRELNQKANKIANFMLAKGFAGESVAAVLVHRDLNFLTAILGILKAGGGYLPLDPQAPVERLRSIFRQSRPQIVFTTADGPQLSDDILADVSEFQVVEIEKITAATEISGEDPKMRVATDNLAYLIFTSGSTGEPKGVMIGHRGMANNIRAKIADFELSSRDRIAETAPQFFDMSVWQFLAPLTIGARVEIVPDEIIQKPHLFFPYLDARKITVMDVVPSFLKMILVAGEMASGLDALRLVVTGGEALTPELAADWLTKFPQIDLVNAYGPTEASDNITHFFINSVPAESVHIPIGRPIINTKAYVVDRRLGLMPVGGFGELFIGGVCVGRGYLNNPDLTAATFLPDPFSAVPGARMFKTGDVARILPDGLIECVGRVDNQIKIRGFRVELGEIENNLLHHDKVREAAVISFEDANGSLNLCAYIVGASGGGIENPVAESRELYEFLKSRLPSYMIPAFYVFIAEIPRTATGKLDRRALPPPQIREKAVDEARSKKLTPTEEILKSVWAEVLHNPNISENDNFFELGGHSLLATQVTSRIRKIWEIDLPLRKLFSVPDLRGLASKIDEQIASRTHPAAQFEIPKAATTEAVPLSFSQQRLWFIEQLEPKSTLYNILTIFRLKGALDVSIFNRAVNFIIRRQSVLRTVFANAGGRAVQKVIPEMEISLAVEDLTADTDGAKEKNVNRAIEQAARQTFDLQKGPLFNFRLLKTGENEHLITLNMHHIISDGWSMGIFIGEIAAVYEAISANRSPELPVLPIQYTDYAAWQQEWMTGPEFTADLNYWRGRLANAPALIEMPTDRPRPSVQTFGGKRKQIEIEENLLISLRATAGRESATLFMVLLAAFYLLLYKYSGRNDLLVGTPVAGRNRRETENLIGFFVNTLVLRIALAAEQTIGGLIGDVRRICFEAYAHQEIPFEKLVEQINPERDLSYSPLFQIVFGLQNTPPQNYTVPDLQLESVNFETNSSKYDITFFMNELGPRLFGVLEYNPDLFDEETVEGLLVHYENVLRAVAGDGLQQIGAVPLLNETEMAEVLHLGTSELKFELAETVIETFEKQVAQSPDRTALADRERQFTYSELNRRANRLAHILRSRGLSPGAKIGHYLERSTDSVAVMLAIFKAGATYVPLDPDYPADRLNFMIGDANLALILTENALAGSISSETADIVRLEEIENELLQHPDTNPPARSCFEDLAYMIYTSGTTGQPKAVAVEHGNLANTLLYSQARFGLMAGDVMPCLASFSFDIALFEVLLPLLNGGKCVVFGKKEILEIGNLVGRLGEFTFLHTVPSLMRQIIEFLKTEKTGVFDTNGIRQIFIGGDKVPVDLLSEMQVAFPAARINILYGPTEGTIICSYYQLGENEKLATHLIGKPIGNNVLRILDPAGNPVPPGVPGELYLGGGSVARGYHRRDELNREKFVLYNALKFYRTGDLTRFRHTGDIEFMGRLDDQVKIRGYRVELGEIESVLSEHEAVREAIVLALRERSAEQFIAAYLVPETSPAPTNEDLRAFLQAKLPSFMIPTAFFMVERIPLTANGKVDRTELRKMKLENLESATVYLPPRTPLEALISEVWKEVLQSDEIGVNHNFFAVGGHSLLLLQLREKLSGALSRTISVVDLFRYPSIAAFAAFLEEAQPTLVEDKTVTERSRMQRMALNRQKQFKAVRD